MAALWFAFYGSVSDDPILRYGAWATSACWIVLLIWHAPELRRAMRGKGERE
ncbi:MAG: hypothetical protein PGN07_12615 [Aeromicrobium erythreum]